MLRETTGNKKKKSGGESEAAVKSPRQGPTSPEEGSRKREAERGRGRISSVT
jgi:hypothetical protein